jgi:serine/threonine-protein kinase
MPQLSKVTPGQTVEGRFHILEEIGRGGMSVVFKATDLEEPVDSARRIVAVKVPLPQYSSGLGSWSMFQREAEIGAKLDHPYVLKYVATGANGGRCVVTEYLSAPTLASRIGKGRRLPEAEALATMSRVCEAVDYLHRQGFVHYDVKPGNVLLCEDGSVRLIDLGMAHDVVTSRFGFAGPSPPFATSDYVAPEQIGKQRGRTSVDIYALGAMLYEALTGHPPFEGDDPFVVASARQIGDPKAPREICPEVSEAVEEIALRALRRDPAERYATAGAMKADLDDPSRVTVSGLARRLVPVTASRKRMRLARFVAITSFAPVAALLVLFKLMWWYFARRH